MDPLVFDPHEDHPCRRILAYRQLQQQLSNEGAFWAGQTPLAQFGSLGAAQGGAAPEATNYSNGAAINPNAGLLGQEEANQLYSGNVNWYQQQANPYLAGLSGGASTLGAASALFGNPFASASTAANPYGQAIAAGGGAAPSDYTY